MSAVKHRLIHCVNVRCKLRLVGAKACGSVKNSGRHVPACIKSYLVRLLVVKKLVVSLFKILKTLLYLFLSDLRVKSEESKRKFTAVVVEL